MRADERRGSDRGDVRGPGGRIDAHAGGARRRAWARGRAFSRAPGDPPQAWSV